MIYLALLLLVETMTYFDTESVSGRRVLDLAIKVYLPVYLLQLEV